MTTVIGQGLISWIISLVRSLHHDEK